jgi:hypothetical protein
MQIIGLGHYSRTGKDSFANYFVTALRERGLIGVKKSFAWKLKDICFQLYAWDGHREPEYYDTAEGELSRQIKLPTLGMTPVELWIAMGTPAVRQSVYDGTWIEYLTRQKFEADALVIPDVRFPNEAEAINRRGGTLVKVVRPGYSPRKSVADEALKDFTGWDFVIGSSGKMTELHYWAEYFATCIQTGTEPIQSESERREALKAELN